MKSNMNEENMGRLLIKGILLIAVAFWSQSLISQPFTRRIQYETPAEIDTFCNTSGQYNDSTRATVFGDSRMEYAYQHSGNLDYFLGASEQGWNVQNFGVSGMTSDGFTTVPRNHPKSIYC